MEKGVGLVVFYLCFTLLGCSSERRPPALFYNDANSNIEGGLQQPPCRDDDFARLRTDFRNCGTCGYYCSTANADRCSEGICQCGLGPTCGENADCRNGACVRADRFTECNTDNDCNGNQTTGRQTCLVDPISGHSFCVDVCEFDDACPAGFVCIEGACTFLKCVPEACDDIDNDCDGEVDENSDSTGPMSRWCYSGPDISRINPPCRKGTQICEIGGRWSECAGEIPPNPEVGLLACNSYDDDCDGCIDGVYEDGRCIPKEPNGFDILYLIDISGSMGSTINAVTEATSRFSAIYAGNPEFRFGLVLISGKAARDARAFVELDFTDFTTFNTRLGMIRAVGGESEPTWDAVYESALNEIAHGVDNNGDEITDVIDETRKGLSWREDSIRIMIMFADERGQSYRTSTRGLPDVSEEDMCASLTHGESLTVFGSFMNELDFDDCATFYTISFEPDEMLARLEGIVTDPCL